MISFQRNTEIVIKEHGKSTQYTADVQRKLLWSEKIEKDIGSWRIHKS